MKFMRFISTLLMVHNWNMWWYSADYHYCFVKVGKTFSYGNGRLDDGKALAELSFQVKDYSSCSFILLNLYLFPISNMRLLCLDWGLPGCGDTVEKSSSLWDLMFTSLICRSNFCRSGMSLYLILHLVYQIETFSLVQKMSI